MLLLVHHQLVFIDSELVEDKNNAGSHNNCTHEDSNGYHIALVLPVGNVTGRTTTAKEGMGIQSITVAAGSCDRSEHSWILACQQLAAIDPSQYLSPDYDVPQLPLFSDLLKDLGILIGGGLP